MDGNGWVKFLTSMTKDNLVNWEPVKIPLRFNYSRSEYHYQVPGVAALLILEPGWAGRRRASTLVIKADKDSEGVTPKISGWRMGRLVKAVQAQHEIAKKLEADAILFSMFHRDHR